MERDRDESELDRNALGSEHFTRQLLNQIHNRFRGNCGAFLVGCTCRHNLGIAWALILGNHPRDKYSLGPGGRTSSSGRCGRASWTQMDPSSNSAPNGEFTNCYREAALSELLAEGPQQWQERKVEMTPLGATLLPFGLSAPSLRPLGASPFSQSATPQCCALPVRQGLHDL